MCFGSYVGFSQCGGEDRGNFPLWPHYREERFFTCENSRRLECAGRKRIFRSFFRFNRSVPKCRGKHLARFELVVFRDDKSMN